MLLFLNWKDKMNKIDELIAQYCQDGVEYKALGELLDYEQPSKYIVKSTKYEKNGIPVLTAGKTFILGYTAEREGIYIADKDNPVIIFDDFTTSYHWVDFSFKVKSSAIKILRPKNKNICFKYIYYAMNTINYASMEHARKWISIYSNLTIPVPPLPVQEEIVKILDAFTSLESEVEKALETELVMRKKQYEYYRSCLLNFESKITNNNVCFMPLSKICNFYNGKGHERSIVEQGKYIVVNSRFISSGGNIKKFTNEQICPVYENDILMVMSDLPNGKALAKCFFVNENYQYTLNQRICRLQLKNEYVQAILPKFLYYVLDRNAQLLKFDNGIDQTNLRKEDILNIILPVPDPDEQKRIVEILDKLDSLINDILESLTTEINSREIQYECYRNKLLTFKPLNSDGD